MEADNTLIGHKNAVDTFLQAVSSGRLHHAWLLSGPEGIGKARLARLMTMRLLGVELTQDGSAFGASGQSEAINRIVQGGHPDLRWVEPETTSTATAFPEIKVDDIRDLTGFFQLRPAMGGYRIAVIDSLDALNRNAENALLKTLEEPPQNAVLILVHHSRKPVLPTIRSRCRMVRLSPLSREEMDAAASLLGYGEALHQLGPQARNYVGSRPGRLISLQTDKSSALLAQLETIAAEWPRFPVNRQTALLQALSADEDAFELSSNVLSDFLFERCREVGDVGSAGDRSRQWLALAEDFNAARRLKLNRNSMAARLVSVLTSFADDKVDHAV